MLYIILKEIFQAFQLNILFLHFYFISMCKLKLKYEFKNEILVNI